MSALFSFWPWQDSHPGVVVGSGTAVLLLAWIFHKILSIALRVPRPLDPKGKHCVVTGGSSGIGKEVAKALAREGAHVTIVARDQGRLDAALRDVEACRTDPNGQKVSSVSVDLGGPYPAVEEAFSKATEAAGPVEVLVNCAGTSWPMRFEEMDACKYEELYRANVLSAMNAARAVIPDMKRRGKGGRIVFTSSQAGQVAVYGYTAYAASKFALRGLAEALQMEVRCHDIMVSLAFPPDTDTPGYAQENKIKPEETRKISQASGVFQPEQVTRNIIKGMKRGSFFISTGFDGYLLGLTTAGMAPCFSVGEAFLQVLTASVMRAVSLVYLWMFYGIAERHQRERERAAAIKKSD